VDKYKPGPGWKRAGIAPVSEHISGIRVHVFGMYRIGQTWVDGTQWPESQEMHRYIRINGGNRKRGVMAWALRHAAK